MTEPRSIPAPSSAPKANLFALIGFIGAFIIPIVGIVLGAMALSQISRTHESGRGLARGAIVVGILGTLFQVGFFILWATLFFGAVSQIPQY